jgi:NitT/TauT family transport system substrate-binding protein
VFKILFRRNQDETVYFHKLLTLSVLFLGLTTSSLYAQTKKDFKVAWSIYVGWMPWDVISSQKIVDK